MRVLLVEDDELTGSGIGAGLRQAGFVVDWARNGREAIEQFDAHHPDVCFLDVHMPGVTGIETRIVRFHNIYGPYGTFDGYYDYAGGYGTYRNGKYWQSFRNACARSDDWRRASKID